MAGIEVIEDHRVPPRSPNHNALCERFHGTVLQECWRRAFRRAYPWNRLIADGAPARQPPDQLDAVRTVLTDDGRSVEQGALAWLWARSDRTIPIPGLSPVVQVEQNAAALSSGPLQPDRVAAIERLAGRARTG